jgi:ABC-type branched-subunit amino acid transport system ATPase component
VIILKTVLGVRIYAIGGSPTATELAGISVDRYVTGLYVVNGFLMGLVAILSTAQVGSASPEVGVGFELLVLTAVILGGVSFTGGQGHPFGVFVGVFTIGILDAGVIFANVASYWQQVVQGGALLIALSADQFAAFRRRQAIARARRRHDGERAAPVMAPLDLTAPGGGHPSSVRPKGPTILACRDLTKYYGPVCAVRAVTLSVAAGEVLCLTGDNGAGKSTVIKALSGAVTPDEGTVEVEGRPVELKQPRDARDLGIMTVYQDLALCPNLGSAENLVLGAEPARTRWGILSWRDDRAALVDARRRLEKLHITLDDYRQPVRLLSGGQRQSVAIARVVAPGVKAVILDEPTAALGLRQSKSTLDLIRSLAEQGVGVIVISHDVETVLSLADRIIVLRQGQVILEGEPSGITEEALIHAMAGYVPRREASAS